MANSTSVSSTKIDRKSLKRPDQFVTSLRQFFGQFAENLKGLIAIGVGLVLLGAFGVWNSERRAAQAVEARDAFYAAENVLSDEFKSVLEEKNKGKKKDSTLTELDLRFMKLDTAKEFPLTVKAFQGVIEKYSGSRSAHEAELALGNLFFHHGQTDQAENYFRKAVDSAPGKPEEAFARIALGSAHENKKEWDQAISVYQKGLNLGVDDAKGTLLMSLGRAYHAKGDVAQAKSTYQRVIDEMKDTEFASRAKTYQAGLTE